MQLPGGGVVRVALGGGSMGSALQTLQDPCLQVGTLMFRDVGHHSLSQKRTQRMHRKCVGHVSIPAGFAARPFGNPGSGLGRVGDAGSPYTAFGSSCSWACVR